MNVLVVVELMVKMWEDVSMVASWPKCPLLITVRVCLTSKRIRTWMTKKAWKHSYLIPMEWRGMNCLCSRPNKACGVVSEVRERLESSGCLESIGCLVLLWLVQCVWVRYLLSAELSPLREVSQKCNWDCPRGTITSTSRFPAKWKPRCRR